MRRVVFSLLTSICACTSPAPAPPPPANVPGPSPLRRLTNAEYLNALSDLFPGQHPTLPELPRDAVIANFENAAEAQVPSDVRIARYETIAQRYAEGAFIDAGCTTPECFIAPLGRRLFRRPLQPDELERLSARFTAWQATEGFEGAARLTLQVMLMSPQFLYRPEPAVDAYAVATRLSFFLWESVPDDVLLDAAATGELDVRAQAERMLKDDRARRVLWSFHRQWLGLDRILSDEHSLRVADATWTAKTQHAAHDETRRFVENTLVGGGTLRDVLTSTQRWPDDETSRFYGAEDRPGVFTRIAFLAGSSHAGSVSPPVRGNTIQSRLLCQVTAEPPPGADLSPPKAPPGTSATNRELFEQRTSPAACRGCHLSLNGFGFGFESYSEEGAFSSADDHGEILGTDVDRPFTGAAELVAALAESRLVHRCAAERWLRYALGRAPTEGEAPLLDALAEHSMRHDVKSLLIALVTSNSFLTRGEP